MGVTLLGVKAGEIKRDKDHFAVTIIDHPGLRTTTYRNPFIHYLVDTLLWHHEKYGEFCLYKYTLKIIS